MGNSQTWMAPIELELPTPIFSQRPSQPPAPVVLSVSSEAETSLSVQAVTSSAEEAKKNLAQPDDNGADPHIHAPDRLTQPNIAPTDKNLPLRWLIACVTILLLSLIMQDALLFLTQQWQTHPWLGIFFSILTLALSGLVLALISREFFRLRQLRTLTSLRQETNHLIVCQTFGSAHALLSRVIQLYQDREEIAPGLQKFHHHVDDYLGDREILELFSSHVLSNIDSQAYQIVVRHASAAALMTAISPMAWLDALLFLWRNVWMVREIAEVYGARPGASGSIVLLRQAIRGMMSAGITDILANSAASSMGDSVAAVVMAKTGQGIANGLFIARIGLQTMNYCRPLPFNAHEKPGLGRIRKELQQALKKSINQPETTVNTL